MRKIYVNLQVKLVITCNENENISNILDEMEYNFIDTTGNATIEDGYINDYEITDSFIKGEI